VSKGSLGADLIAVSSANSVLGDITRFLKISQDIAHLTLRDPYLV
jgi:hypothetical protein